MTAVCRSATANPATRILAGTSGCRDRKLNCVGAVAAPPSPERGGLRGAQMRYLMRRGLPERTNKSIASEGRTGRSQSHSGKRFERCCVSDHSVCGVSERGLFFDAAATPPHDEGNGAHYRRFIHTFYERRGSRIREKPVVHRPPPQYYFTTPAPGSRTRLLNASFSEGTQKSSSISCLGSSRKIFFSLTQGLV